MYQLNIKNELIIVKLGGSLITDKNEPFSIRENVLNDVIKQIIASNEQIILIHGGGSFGHPLAKKYGLFNGPNQEINDQKLGLSKTHLAMTRLNTFIISKFLENNFPIMTIHPSSIFIKEGDGIKLSSIRSIEILLNLGICPLLHGDIILEEDKSFSIISGDQIILELIRNLTSYKVKKVIFAIEEDGIYLVNKNNEQSTPRLALKLNSEDLDEIILAKMDEKIDVTGGIKGKLSFIKKIAKLKVPIQIINGLKKNYVIKALKNKDLECTNIYA